MAIDHLPVEMADGSTGFVHGSRVWDTGGLAPAATGTGTGTQDQHEEDTHSQSWQRRQEVLDILPTQID
jgi:hypothetical protein